MRLGPGFTAGECAARDSNPNRQIRSLVLCVDLVGSRRI
jgi:hypothetical protein